VQLLYIATNNATLFTHVSSILTFTTYFYQHIFLYSTKQNTNNAYIPHPLQIFFLQLLYQYPKLYGVHIEIIFSRTFQPRIIF